MGGRARDPPYLQPSGKTAPFWMRRSLVRQRSPAAAHSGRQRASQDSVDGKWVTGSGSSRAPVAGLSEFGRDISTC